MHVFDSPAAMRSWARPLRASGSRIGLVPTMGALHAGHLALIDAAKVRCDDVVVSIFVNSLQFNRRDDFEQYPRDFAVDLDPCRQRDVSAVYAPTSQSMYPGGFQTHVVPGAIAAPLEGAGRPGHFEGVTTVVAKLFNAVQPNLAFFGEKDYQQLAVIKRMVVDLDMEIEIVGVATVREPDGLAMSSRNRRLDPAQRVAARVVPAALDAVEQAFRTGLRDVAALRSIGQGVVDTEPAAHVEYLEVVDPDTLQPATADSEAVLVTTAIWFGDVRLIDNRLVNSR